MRSFSIANAPARRRPLVALVLPVLAAVAAIATTIACDGEDEARACRVGADCVSGMCGTDGTCVDGPGMASSSSGGGADAAPGSELDASLPPDDGGKLVVPGCAPNKDGAIVRDEVPIKPGLQAKYRVAEDVEVSTAGTPIADGRRRWDFSAALPNETTVLVETLPLDGKWYAPQYANASYATQLRKSSDIVGVFETAEGSLVLRGIASPSDGFGKTQLVHEPPVAMLQFPLTLGKSWSTTSTVSGTAQNITYVKGFNTYTEKYDANVDAAGELVTPLGTFEVLRVRVEMTRTYGAIITTSRTYAFVTECYGTVANVFSKDNESNVEFTRAAEIRRIAP